VTEPGRGPGRARIIVWIVVGALAVYLLVNGILGILEKGA
jgi:hypothetical protein